MVNAEGKILHKLKYKKGRQHDYSVYKDEHPITPTNVENYYDLGYQGVEKDFPNFINHLKSIKRYVRRKRNIKRFILVIDNTSFHVSKKTKQFIERQSDYWLTVLFIPTRSPFLNLVETKVNRNLKKDVCANYNYETEYNLLCTVRRYLRCMGSWPKI